MDDGICDLVSATEIRGDYGWVSGTGMAAGEEFACYLSQVAQSLAAQLREVDTTFVIVQLADGVIVFADVGPAQEKIGYRLDAALSYGYTLALILVAARFQIRSIGGLDFLFDLQEQRIFRPVAFHQDNVITQSDTSGANNFEGDVQRAKEFEQVEPLGRERAKVQIQAV